MSDFNDNELEHMLTDTFGPPPSADIDAWRKRHPSALAWLNPQRFSALSKRRKRMQRILISTATAVAAICVWLGVGFIGTNGSGSSAFAQTVEQIQKAKTITFRVTYHSRVTDTNGKEWAEETTIQRAIREPGLWRSETLDKSGQVVDVQLRDYIHGRDLMLYPKKKEAFLRDDEPDPKFSGMSAWLKEQMAVSDWEWVGKSKTAAGEANIFRHTTQEIIENSDGKGESKTRTSSYDVWIDRKTKKLVRFQRPGADIYDFDQHPATDSDAIPVARHREHAVAIIYSDFVFDADLDDSLFRFDPPEGYAVTSEDYPEVTEGQIIEYLGLIAKCRDEQFPDQVSQSPYVAVDWLNTVINKKDPTTVEKRFVEMHFLFDRVNQKPFARFAECFTETNSFRYIGKGVKLGDKDAIVCWYKLKDAKDPSTYRVVYGDLSVKDVPAKDLPLPVEP